LKELKNEVEEPKSRKNENGEEKKSESIVREEARY